MLFTPSYSRHSIWHKVKTNSIKPRSCSVLKLMKYRIFCVFDPDESGSAWNYTKVWFYIWPSACLPFEGPQYNTMLKRGEKLFSTLNNYKYRLRANFQWAGKIPIWNVWRHTWKEVEACKFIHCNLIPYNKPSWML